MSTPHATGAAAVAEALDADLDRGLSTAEAASRLARDGPNRIAAPHRVRYGAIAVRQLVDPLVALLVAAAAVASAIGDWVEGVAIGVIVVANAVLGFVQEARAESAVRALREAVGRRARVVRGGQEVDVPAEDLVAGDLLVLHEGDRVEADGRLLEELGLAVDESILTGESVPVEKRVDAVAPDSPLGDRACMVFAGTWATRGRGVAVVTATGDRTEQGRIAALAGAAKPPRTPLQARLARLVRIAVVAGIAITVLVSATMAVRGASADEAFLVGVSVAIAAVPEGLTAAVTIALALGAAAMASRGAIVRRLSAVETLGETTVICTDKTGTLTENRLRVARCEPAPGVGEDALLEAAVLASGAVPLGAGKAAARAGDPIDAALLRAAGERGIGRSRLLAGRRLVEEVPFDPLRRRSASVYEEDGRHRLVVKGAPETLLELAAGGSEELEELAGRASALASSGGRVLAIAERVLPPGLSASEAEDAGVRLLGLVVFEDPLREAVPDAVDQARTAGIDVVMITGDHPATARAIGEALLLAPDAVHARVEPARKLELVEELQRDGDVVAVTGDGINDAPALRRADVGVSMGRSGTEAAREASALVLTDDNFATIVAAIREGRRIADNIRTFVAFLLSANLGEVVLFFIAIAAGLGPPMTVVQVLTVNVLTDGLPAVALSRDPAAGDVMTRRPRPTSELFTSRMWAGLVGLGAAVGLAGLASFLLGRELWPSSEQTMAFATIALAELLLAFSIRSGREPAWRLRVSSLLGWSVAGSAGLVFLLVYVPALHEPFGTVALGGAELGAAAGLAVLPAAVAELAKWVLRLGSSPQRGSARIPMRSGRGEEHDPRVDRGQGGEGEQDPGWP